VKQPGVHHKSHAAVSTDTRNFALQTLRWARTIGAKKPRPRMAQAAQGMPRSDRGETDLEYGLSLGLISPSPPHGQDTRGCHLVHAQKGIGRPTAIRRPRTPIVGALALHGVSGGSSGSHLGSTLMSGRAVLTRGVSRRLGSVAYVCADASPTEMLAPAIVSNKSHGSQANTRKWLSMPRQSTRVGTAARGVGTDSWPAPAILLLTWICQGPNPFALNG
jgi:hypothetical protein